MVSNWLLVGGLEHLFFSPILGIILPIDELIFFRGVGQPPTSLHWYYIPICSMYGIFTNIYPINDPVM
jgi:hypothetical protein